MPHKNMHASSNSPISSGLMGLILLRKIWKGYAVLLIPNISFPIQDMTSPCRGAVLSAKTRRFPHTRSFPPPFTIHLWMSPPYRHLPHRTFHITSSNLPFAVVAFALQAATFLKALPFSSGH